jgi:nitroreductase
MAFAECQNEGMFDESFAEAWKQRYGSDPPFDFPQLAPFLTHRSIRSFSPEPVPEETVRALIGAAQSAATSSNLQLWSVISVQDAYQRQAVAEAAGDQQHVRLAPWFFVFLADTYRLRKAAKSVDQDAAGLDYAEFTLMATIDAALACEHMVCAAEKLGLGICYIGAVRNNPPRIQQLLNLPEGTAALFGLCLGFPREGVDASVKPRLQQEAVWFREQYNQDVEVSEYNERMTPFYISQGMKGEVNWSMRSARRVDGSHLTGREVLKEYLEKQGLYKR